MDKKRQSPLDIHEQSRLLRARIDSELRKPAVIMVTSAESGDGSHFTANALARAFIESGRQTALFCITRDGRVDQSSKIEVMNKLKTEGSTSNWIGSADSIFSRDTLGGFVSSVRSFYDITIVSAPALSESSAVVTLGDSADAILIAIRRGRKAGEGDEIAAKVLDGCKTARLGIVITSAEAVSNFDREIEAAERVDDSQRKLVTSLSSNVKIHERASANIAVSIALFAILTIFALYGSSHLGPKAAGTPVAVSFVASEA